MENQNSQPALVPPEVPSNFDSVAGNSKREFAQSIMNLLKGATITGINQASPIPYDLAALSTRVQQLEDDMDVYAKGRKVRRVTVAGTNNSNVIVNFADIGTTNYDVRVQYLWPGGAFPTVSWAVVNGSQLTNQVTIRNDGTASAFTLLVTIEAMDTVAP